MRSNGDPDASRPLGRHHLPEPLTVASADGLEIAAYDLGGDGPDVVLVHATGFCAGVWLPTVEHLKGFRCVALDVRGHGCSGKPEEMDWHDTAQDVLATVKAFDLQRPFGVGHSMGGASLVLAELAAPATFSGLWVFEPIIFPARIAPPEGARNPLAEGARRRRPTFPSREEAYDNFASKPPLDVFDPAALAAYVDHGFEQLDDGSVQLRCSPEVEAMTYESGMRHGAFERLGRVRCPVTVLCGRDDAPGPATVAPLVAEELPDGRLEEHPEIGHFGPLEDPAGMAASIRSAVTAAS